MKFTNLLLLLFCVKLAFTQNNYKQKPIKTFESHSFTVFSTDYSSNGKLIATASWDKTIKLWNIESGELLRTFEGHLFPVFSVSFSNDDKYLVSTSKDNSVKLWEIESGRLVKTFLGHTSWVHSGCFSPDGKQIASSSSDKTIIIWDVNTGKQIRQITGHTDEVLNVKFSNDGKYLASTSKDKTIKLWNTSDGTNIKTFTDHTNAVWSIDFSPNGKYIVSGSQDMTIKQWDIASGEVKWTIQHPAGWVNCVRYSPDGNYILSSSHEQLNLLRSKNGQIVNSIKEDAGAIYSVSFSPCGKYVLSSYKQMARLWDVSPFVGPPIEWKRPIDNKQISSTLNYEVKLFLEHDADIESLSIYLNDSLYQKDENINISDTDTANTKSNYQRKIKLISGENKIKIIANNIAGFTSTERKINYPLLPALNKGKQKRLALVLGNADYNNINKLSSNIQNTKTISNEFTKLGFDVLLYNNVCLNNMQEIIDDFIARQANYETILFFYAGHGIQSNGINYLVPADAKLENCTNIEKECIRIDYIFSSINNDTKTNIIILDASIDGSWKINNHKGLNFMKIPSNSIIAYSCLPGETHNKKLAGLYTLSLIEQLQKTENKSITHIFDKVRSIVEQKSKEISNKKQTPMELVTLKKPFYFK